MFHRTQKVAAVLAAALLLGGCATLTEDTHTPVTLTFSSGENGSCKLTNKRGAWETPVPVTVSIRKSDDALKYDCKTDSGKTAFGSIPSEMGGKIVASAVFLDFGITDKHRRYPANFVIVVPTKNQDTRSIPAAKQ